MRWLETDTLNNVDISTALEIASYVSDGDRLVICDAAAYEVQGNGDYTIYMTHEISGLGAVIVLPKTIMQAEPGETAIGGQSAPITVRNGDILKVYLEGLPGDTVTVDTVVRWYEFDACSFPSGAIEFTYTVTDSGTGNPVPDVQVWISTDLAGTNIIWTGYTNAFGIALDAFGNLPLLDAGTYYFWKQRVGYIPDEIPDIEVVS